MEIISKIFKTTIPFSFLVFTITSCYKLTPSGFWVNFHPNEVEFSESDQGPWGGTRKMDWKLLEKTKNHQLIDFAQNNGWTFVDSLTLTNDKLKDLDIKNDYSDYILSEKAFLNLNDSKYKILRFKSGWVSIEPGNLSETLINGFIIIDLNNNFQRVYHSWGE